MAIALVILVLALVGGYFLARRNWPQESRAFLLPLIGWVGGLLILVSLVFLPWVALGPAGAMAANADWIASQAAILETIQSIPAFESLLQGVEAPTGAELLASLDQPVTEKLLEYNQVGLPITGFGLVNLAFRANPSLGLFLIGLGLCGLITAGIYLTRLAAGRFEEQPAIKLLGIFSFMFLAGLLGYLVYLDTLGIFGKLGLRLVLSLAEARVASGAYLALLGLLLVVVASLGDFFPVLFSYETNLSDNRNIYQED